MLCLFNLHLFPHLEAAGGDRKSPIYQNKLFNLDLSDLMAGSYLISINEWRLLVQMPFLCAAPAFSVVLVNICSSSRLIVALKGSGNHFMHERSDRDKQSHTHIHTTGQLDSPIKIICMSLDCGRTLEHPERIQVATGLSLSPGLNHVITTLQPFFFYPQWCIIYSHKEQDIISW